jgi:hypothetical protein
MAKKHKTGAPHPSPLGHAIRALAKKPAPGRAKAAPSPLAVQLGTDNADLQDDDWVGRQLPTFD